MIRKELLCFNQNLKNKDEVIDNLINLIYENRLLSDKQEYKEAIYKREEEFSTAVGFNVAIPHGICESVKEAYVAVMISDTPVKWDHEEVRLIFMIGVPLAEKNVTHLKVISNISRKLVNEDFRQALLSCRNVDEAFDLLNQINEGIKGE